MRPESFSRNPAALRARGATRQIIFHRTESNVVMARLARLAYAPAQRVPAIHVSLQNK
jgi:hypothetical protein